MKEKILIEIERFTGIEEQTPEVVYLPFETAYQHPYRKFHENAWAAVIDNEIVLVDESLENLWDNLEGIVFERLASVAPENGNGWLTTGDYPEEESPLDNDLGSEEETPSDDGE